MRPYHILLFLLLVFALGLGTAAVWPKNGLPLTREWRLSFASLDDVFGSDTTRQVNLDSLLASYEVTFDSTAIKDSLQRAQIAYRLKMMRIQYADSSARLNHFFQALYEREQGVGKVRILHYGDSQIEGDRITSDIRNGLQKLFGGSGPGYVSACPLTSSISLNNVRSANWRRFPVFGNQDSTLMHNHFGMYAEFSRFTAFPRIDTVFQEPSTTTIKSSGGARDTTFLPDPKIVKLLPHDTTVHAWIELSPSKIGYMTSRRFTKMTILFRNPDAPFKLRVVLSDSTESRRDFAINPNAREYTQSFVSSPDLIRLEFEAKSSPDIYGIRLENDYGIVMDNIPMRGSSGTYFGKINNAEMATQFSSTNPDLIILQFGGNTVPYMTNDKVGQYGNWFAAQIRYLKRMNPQCDFVLIGPSDMSIKEGTKYITYPILPAVRDVLRTTALDNGIGYWDMYEVMGGRNSMPSWVSADPPLAAPDYVHFTRQGAQKVAQLFYDALMKDYEEWKSGK
jgi:lysophospholipase L1-like esterase